MPKRKASSRKSLLDSGRSQDGPDVESENKNSELWGREFADDHLNALKKDASFLGKYLILRSNSLPTDESNHNTGDSSSNLILNNSVDTSKRLCLNPGCKRKCGSLCSFGLCVACCIQSADGTTCTSHLSARRRKEDEDRWAAQGVEALLNEGQRKGGRPHSNFYHFEERFLSFGQTVVIWCFADFCRRKEWSSDTFALGLKEQALKARRSRRFGSSVPVRKSSSASAPLSSASASSAARLSLSPCKSRPRKSQVAQPNSELNEPQMSSSSSSVAVDESNGIAT